MRILVRPFLVKILLICLLKCASNNRSIKKQSPETIKPNIFRHIKRVYGRVDSISDISESIKIDFSCNIKEIVKDIKDGFLNKYLPEI
jgi:hypothetical protein